MVMLTSPPSLAGQVILAIAYGIDVAPHGDPNVEVAEKAVGAIIAGSLRGRIFDLFPFRTCGQVSPQFHISLTTAPQSYTCPGGSPALVSKRKRETNGCRMSSPRFTARMKP